MNSKLIDVNIIIPYKDNYNYLISTLNSLFSQTYKKYKILIIYDDENQDDLEQIRNFLARKKRLKKKVRILVNKKNLGAGISRNKGIQASNSKYIAFIDSDDLWKKNKLKFQINFMEKYKLVISHTSYYVINKKSQKISSRIAKKKIYYKDLISSCDIGLSTVILNTKFIKKNKFYFPSLKTKEDYVLWLKIIKKINVIYGINKKLSFYRKLDNSLSSNNLLNLKNGYIVYRKYMKFNIFKSFFHLIILSFSYLYKKITNDLNNNNKL